MHILGLNNWTSRTIRTNPNTIPNTIKAAVTLKNATNPATMIPIDRIGHQVRMPTDRATINSPMNFNTLSVPLNSLFSLSFMFFKF